MELEAKTKDRGTTLRAPTSEAGLAPACKDTCFADLRLRIFEQRHDGTEGKVRFGGIDDQVLFSNNSMEVLIYFFLCG